MVKSLRLAWLKRIFNENDGTWKRYLKHQLKSVAGVFSLQIVITTLMTAQFLPNFIANSCFGGNSSAKTFASESNWQEIIWNDKEIRTDKKPVYFKNCLCK